MPASPQVHMDTQRIILAVIFSFSAIMLWEAWQREHAPPVPAATTQIAPSGKAAPAARSSTADLPAAPSSQTAGAPPTATPDATAAGERLTIKTDLYTAEV